MMTRIEVDRIKEEYPPGSHVKLIKMKGDSGEGSELMSIKSSKNTQKTAYNLHFAKERNKCLGSKLRDIFYTTSMVLLGKLKNQTKRDLRRSLKSEKWEVSRSKYDPSNCRIRQ